MLAQVAITPLVGPRDVEEFAEASLHLVQEPINPTHSEQVPKAVRDLPHSAEGSIIVRSRVQLSSTAAIGVLTLTESYFTYHHSVLPQSRQPVSEFL